MAIELKHHDMIWIGPPFSTSEFPTIIRKKMRKESGGRKGRGD
jgi:hypothetical protein